MAPRWMNTRSSWANDGSTSTTAIVVISVMTLIIGAAGGYFFGHREAGQAAVDPRLSPIAESNVAAMTNTLNDQGGAVKAATSLIAGFPALAADTSLARTEALKQIIAEDADANVLTILTSAIESLRQQVFITGGQGTTAKVIATPVVYKSVLGADGSVTVTVWYTTVIADATGSRFRSAWTTAIVTLKWSDRWKIKSLDSKDGPTPSILSLDGKPDPVDSALSLLDYSFAYRHALAP